MRVFNALWAIADEADSGQGWTDNELLHRLINVLEDMPLEQQEQIIAAVKEQANENSNTRR